ncbi:hypothetical protein FRB90_000212 [Tulasnella sp. 427]|nr:hypothetical protein FRB90_000212 [Tulasnella sp. 427]
MEAVTDLLEKKALNFIDRQRFTMLNEILGLAGYLTINPCNALFKAHRALLKPPISAPVIKKDYSKILELKSPEYLQHCLSRPEDFLAHVSTHVSHNPYIPRIVAETIIKITYERLEDGRGMDYVRANVHMMDIVVADLEGYAVDLIPALQYLPSWLPGMEFKRTAASWSKDIDELEFNLLESVKDSLQSDDPEVRSSFMFKKFDELYQGQDETPKDAQKLEDEVMGLTRVGLTLFLGGVETTRNTIETLILAISLFP